MKFTAARTRIASIDIVRGLAIMGILLVNGPTLNGSATKDMVDFAFQNSSFDVWYSNIIFLFAMGKFYPIFACLFGITSAILLSEKKAPVSLFLRRLLILFCFGILHIILVWWGDILVVYSLLGFLLILVYQKSKNALFGIFSTLLFLILVLSIISVFFNQEKQLIVPLADEIYQHGSFIEISKQRLFDYFGVYVPGIFYKLDLYHIISFSIYFLQLFLMFILGFYMYRSGLLIKLNDNRQQAKKVFLFFLTTVFALVLFRLGVSSFFEVISYWQGIAQGLLYASAVIYLCHFPRAYRFLSLLAPVGRMSITNYIFHTFSLSLLFYSYGLGLYGKIGPFLQAPILLLLMLSSLIFSGLWLKYFNNGPIEWIWRSAVHRKILPLR